MKISLKEARRLAIHGSGLASSTGFGAGKNAVFKAINHLGYVQIDTISVVARAHHHVLATRVANYQEAHLAKLQEERKILEYWAHAAAYLPMQDYRFTLPLKNYFREKKDPWPKSEKNLVQKVLDRVKLEGPLMARDFEGDRMRKGEGWWDWKPAKLALERLFLEGSLVTVGRSGFQKIYDIPENVIPSDINVSMPANHEFAEYLIYRSLQSLGIASLAEICYLRKNVKPYVTEVLEVMIRSGDVTEVEVAGLSGQVYFSKRANLESTKRVAKHLKILSPFDNFTIQRARLLNFFNYDYQIECYVPQPKRKWGYFCLPILFGEQLVGRVDAKADRKPKELVIKNLHLEGQEYKKIPCEVWQKAFEDFALFNGCEKIRLVSCTDPDFTLKDPGA